MKRPNKEQFEQLLMLRQYNKVLEYLTIVEYDYIESLISATTLVEVHQLQGALTTVRKLREIILTDQR